MVSPTGSHYFLSPNRHETDAPTQETMRIPTACSLVPQSKSFVSPLGPDPAAQYGTVPRVQLEAKVFGRLSGVSTGDLAVRAQLETPIQERSHHSQPCFSHWDSLVLFGVLGVAHIQKLVAHVLIFARACECLSGSRSSVVRASKIVRGASGTTIPGTPLKAAKRASAFEKTACTVPKAELVPCAGSRGTSACSVPGHPPSHYRDRSWPASPSWSFGPASPARRSSENSFSSTSCSAWERSNGFASVLAPVPDAEGATFDARILREKGLPDAERSRRKPPHGPVPGVQVTVAFGFSNPCPFVEGVVGPAACRRS